MQEKGMFSVGAFAKYSRTTKDALLHYDRIGLLSPTFRADNGYRYYHHDQLAVVNVIRTMQDLGLSLLEIKEKINQRDFENFEEAYSQQIAQIDERVIELNRTRQLLLNLRHNMLMGLHVDENEITVKHLAAEPLVLGQEHDFSLDANDYDFLNIFYQETQKRYPHMNLNYPVWGYFAKERIEKRDWHWPSRFYFYHPEGKETRAAGLYAIGYTRGGYGDCGDLYKRLLFYIEKEGYEIAGPAFEEYLLNEIIVTDVKGYLIRVMIEVCKSAK